MDDRPDRGLSEAMPDQEAGRRMDHLSLLRRRRCALLPLLAAAACGALLPLGSEAQAQTERTGNKAASSPPSRDELARLMLSDAQQWADRGWVREAESLARRAAEYHNDWGDDEVTPASFLAELGAAPRNTRPPENQPKSTLQQPPALRKPTPQKRTPPAMANTAQPLRRPRQAAPLPQQPQPAPHRTPPAAAQAAPQPTRVVVQTIPAPAAPNPNTEEPDWFIPTIVIVTLASFATGTVVSLVGVAAFGVLAPRRAALENLGLRQGLQPEANPLPEPTPPTEPTPPRPPAPTPNSTPDSKAVPSPQTGSLFEQVVQQNIGIKRGLNRTTPTADSATEAPNNARLHGRD